MARQKATCGDGGGEVEERAKPNLLGKSKRLEKAACVTKLDRRK